MRRVDDLGEPECVLPLDAGPAGAAVLRVDGDIRALPLAQELVPGADAFAVGTG